MNSVMISAIHKSSGKTTVTVGLSAALARRGGHVQTFKKGPDYIDPMWLSQASRRACRNLDFRFMSPAEIAAEFVTYGGEADINIVEGNKGLFDGIDVEGTDSNAALAQLLGTPIILVVDTRGMTRGIAPLIKGYTDFSDEIEIAGIIFNQVGGPRHESKLRAALERYTDVPVIGAIGRYEEMEIGERHLGLVPANESCEAADKIETIADIIEANVELGIFGALACTTNEPKVSPVAGRAKRAEPANVRIAIARDAAFGFYYPSVLEAFETAGATLVPFNTLTDLALPEVDGLFIGGGFPETQMDDLSANLALRNHIKKAVESGLPTYAECAGLMYLSNSLTWQGETRPMVGVVAADAVMQEKPVGRGYVKLVETDQCPWPGKPASGQVIAAHEFHYASLEGLGPELAFAFDVQRGVGITGTQDGLLVYNLLAGFAHRSHTVADNWVERFVAFVRQCKEAEDITASLRRSQIG